MPTRDPARAAPPPVNKRAKAGRPRDDGLAERRRGDIILHAIEEFARASYAGADLDAIARNAGVSKGTLYNYFDSKRELFNASVDHVMFNMKSAVGADDPGDIIEQLRTLVRGFLQYFATHPQYVELLVQERSDIRERSQPAYYAYRTASRQQWKKRFQQLIKDGRMRQMPPDQAINIMGDLLYGTIFMNHFRGRDNKPARQAEEIVSVLLGGLLTEVEFNRQQSQQFKNGKRR